MSPQRSGLILLLVSARHAHLPEYLAERGYEVSQSAWGIAGRSPRVIITDQPQVLAESPELLTAIQHDRTGLVLLGRAESAEPTIDLPADADLPTDATSREVASVIDLVAQLVEQRRRADHERAECQRWVDLAMHDPLTGLPNRRAWDEELARSLAGGALLCIGLVDVDYFKQINDADGHDVGDAVLRETARTLRSHLRGGDFVARLGGDEFGLILRGAPIEQAHLMLDRLRQVVARQLAAQRLPTPSLSAGFCGVASDRPRDAAGVFAAAAAALHAAKRQRDNRGVTSLAAAPPLKVPGKLEKI